MTEPLPPIAPPHTVVFVTHSPFVSGAERSLVRLAAALDPGRYRPFVVTSHQGELPRALGHAEIKHVVVPMPWPERTWPFPFLRAVTRLALRFRRSGAALAHVNDTPAYPVAGLAARLAGVPRICHLRFLYDPDGLRWYLKWGFERVVFPSQFLQESAQAQCPGLFPADRCTVLPNGFDPPPTPDRQTLADVGAALRLAPGDPVVGFFGQVIEIKGVREYLFMAKRLRQRMPSCRFLIVGDDQQQGPNYRLRMEALARDLGIAPACSFTGFRNDVWELMHLCSLVVMPSHVEPFGIVALEAGAAGRPIIASRVGGLPEIVRDGETGMLVPPRDALALSEAAWTLLSNSVLRSTLGAQARAHVHTQFSATLEAQRVADLYDETLAAGPLLRA